MFLRSDEPTLADHLDRTELVRRVGEAIAECEPPQVVGIHGDWGVGKTSFLHQLHWFLSGDCPQQTEGEQKAAEDHNQQLSSDKQPTVVWFEAWRYQHDKAPVVALLHEIRAQLPWYSKALKQSRKLGEVTVRGALLSLEDLTKRIGIQASKIDAAGQRWEEENLAVTLPSHVLRSHLEAALGTLLGKTRSGKNKNRRLVVMIDDLDRCEPETAYQLLEGIKIYLNLPSCVFVLGMNQRLIEQAVAQHLAEKDSTVLRYRAREYLEKLCQVIWHLPVVPSSGALLGHYLGEGVQGSQEIVQVVREHDCLPRNPRKIKAFANVVLRFHGHWLKLRGDDWQRWAKLMVIFAYLYHFQNRIYRILEARPSFYRELERWCKGQPTPAEEHFEEFERRRQRPDYEPRETEWVVSGLLPPKSDKAPTPNITQMVERFLDPAAPDVLHVEPLIASLTATETEAKDYLPA